MCASGHLGNLQSKPGTVAMGAGGALWALLGLYTWINGSRKLHLPKSTGLPDLKIGPTIQDIFWVGIAVELACLMLRPRMMNCWAHVGGALFGMLYVPVISKHCWPTAEDDIDRATKLEKFFGC